MANNIFYKEGKVLEYRLKKSEIFTNGDIVKLGHYIAVSTANAGEGDLVALQISGIWDLPYKDNEAVDVGTPLYYDESTKKLTKTEASNIFVGLANQPASVGDKVVRVHLKGVAL